MAIRLSITLLCALAVFTVGSGIRGVHAAEERAAISLEEVYAGGVKLARNAAGEPVLPTVVVTASPDDVRARPTGPGVMLDRAVEQASVALANGASRSVRKIGLAMPYYAFGSNARGTE